MADRQWRFGYTSVAGSSHERLSLPCQDAAQCILRSNGNQEPVLVAVASDGAGSAARAEVGAALACRLMTSEIVSWHSASGEVPDLDKPFFGRWLATFQNKVADLAALEGFLVRDYACTLLAAVIAPSCCAFLQVGDGAIIVANDREPEQYGWVFWPQQGEYINHTNFLTDPEAAEHLEFEVVDSAIEELALFTDGLQGIALHNESRSVHVPFFRPFFQAARLLDPGFSAELSAQLTHFLQSERVTDRTDDDKTLIIATRRIPAGMATLVQ